MVSCPECSAQNSNESKFCSECGSALKPENGTTRTLPAERLTTDSDTPSDSSVHGRFLPGTRLANRYRIVSLLGKGGMGEVYRADDLTLGQTVALKFLPPELAAEPKRLELFRGEVRLTRQISHPNVCRVYDIGEVDGQNFLSMEFIDGEDLKSLLRRIGRLPKDKGIQIAHQLCAGLAAAHEKGVLHRDLKPANIMIDGKGQVRITDFGLARRSEGVADAGEVAGTPAYMAPEQLAGRETSIQADVYSLGLVLYEMFTGERAYRDSSLPNLLKKREQSTPTSPSAVMDDIDPAVERVILRCLETDVSQRPTSARAIAAALPGGDPLVAALAAGETPTPQMVASAGEAGWLSPTVAGTCLAGVVMGLALVAVLAQRTHLINRCPLEHEPEVLEHTARSIMRHLGYDDRAASFATGFVVRRTEVEYVQNVDIPQDGSDRRELFNRGPWPGIRFWYRQSPEVMCPTVFDAVGGEGYNRGIRVTLSTPAWTESKMVGAGLDPRGGLRWFRAVPPRGVYSESRDAGQRAKWSEWFRQDLLGFNLDDLSPADWHRTPPDAYDQTQTWEGTWPDSDEPLHVVAAAYRGRPVYFEVLLPTEMEEDALFGNNRPNETRNGTVSMALSTIFLFVEVGAVILAWRNLRLGRSDRRGAFRLAMYFFFINMVVWLFCGNHGDFLAEQGSLYLGLASATFLAARMWVFYVAIEPLVRRLWPGLLVSWARLLDGRFRDPLVGRDFLVGASAGIGFVVALSCVFLVVNNLNPMTASGDPVWPTTLLGAAPLISETLNVQLVTIDTCLFFLVFLLLARIILRSERGAACCLVVVMTIATVTFLVPPLPGWWLTLLASVMSALGLTLFVWILVRFGLLALIAMHTAQLILFRMPITSDTSAFYFPYGLFALSLVASIAVFGFYTSLGGKPMLGKMTLE